MRPDKTILFRITSVLALCALLGGLSLPARAHARFLANNNIIASDAAAPLEPTPSPGEEGGTGVPNLSTLTIIIIASVLAALAVVVVIVIVLVLVNRKRKEEMERDRRWKEIVQGEGVSEPALGMEDRTMDSFPPGEGVLGLLVVLESDDSSLRGQRFEINRSVTTLGRKSTNDIMFPKDGTVSRQHAVIEERGGRLYFSEIMSADEAGRPRRPTCGTFVNNRQIEASVALRTGDQIRLGKQVRMRFEGIGENSSNMDHTMDQFSDSDKTSDG